MSGLVEAGCCMISDLEVEHHKTFSSWSHGNCPCRSNHHRTSPACLSGPRTRAERAEAEQHDVAELAEEDCGTSDILRVCQSPWGCCKAPAEVFAPGSDVSEPEIDIYDEFLVWSPGDQSCSSTGMCIFYQLNEERRI